MILPIYIYLWYKINIKHLMQKNKKKLKKSISPLIGVDLKRINKGEI